MTFLSCAEDSELPLFHGDNNVCENEEPVQMLPFLRLQITESSFFSLIINSGFPVTSTSGQGLF